MAAELGSRGEAVDAEVEVGGAAHGASDPHVRAEVQPAVCE